MASGLESSERELPAAGANLTVKLAKHPASKGRLDDFPLDDVAYALIPQRAKSKVLLVSNGNLYLEGALLLDENATYQRVTHKTAGAFTCVYEISIRS